MLTGDKGSTAKTIGHTCGLFNHSMNIFEISEENLQDDLDKMYNEVVRYIEVVSTNAVTKNDHIKDNIGMLIAGTSIEAIMVAPVL